VSVQLLQILGTTHFYRGERRPEYELIGVVYLGTIAPPGNITISVEHSEYRWVSAEEAKNLLENDEGTEGWLARVIDRAEVLKSSLPSSLLELFWDTGFELDP